MSTEIAPILGEIRLLPVGKKRRKYIWHACTRCGIARWTAASGLNLPIRDKCRPCGLNHKLDQTVRQRPDWIPNRIERRRAVARRYYANHRTERLLENRTAKVVERKRAWKASHPQSAQSKKVRNLRRVHNRMQRWLVTVLLEILANSDDYQKEFITTDKPLPPVQVVLPRKAKSDYERYHTDPAFRAAAIARSKKRSTEKKEEVTAYKNKWHRQKIAKDPLYRLRVLLRRRTGMAFVKRGWRKRCSTAKLLGGDWLTVKAWIESQFTVGMSWENHGQWHVDHIIPLATASNSAELVKLFHFSNLQPLWAKENLSKGGRIGWFPDPHQTGRLF